MMANISTLFLFRWLAWIKSAKEWRRDIRAGLSHRKFSDHALTVAGWAKQDYQTWKEETFQ